MKNKDIFKLTLPVMFGYIPLSIAYAILGVSCNIDTRVLVLFSLFVYAGSGQFLLVALLSAGTNLSEVFIATFLLNLRHSYTISLMSDIVNLKIDANSSFWLLLCVMLVAGVATFLTRALPYFFLKNKSQNKTLIYLEKNSALFVMVILVFYALKATPSNSFYIVEILAILVCLFTQIRFKNAFLSIATSTIFCMILSRVF
ncbi:AzlC family ABC transporter permease [Campylobacter ureolyticus]|uniref:AzlC family ABC transporter permease n=1 Tax=Campylobacter ureolyticus TaxID=827 RepID=UPI0026EAE756|nr:AzlC family ABC transporter permease [Campylobacter ureolyticus]